MDERIADRVRELEMAQAVHAESDDRQFAELREKIERHDRSIRTVHERINGLPTEADMKTITDELALVKTGQKDIADGQAALTTEIRAAQVAQETRDRIRAKVSKWLLPIFMAVASYLLAKYG